jgi:hypothetical protein
MGLVRRTVHVPLDGDTERALDLPRQPASCQGDSGSVGMLLAELGCRTTPVPPDLSGASGPQLEPR